MSMEDVIAATPMLQPPMTVRCRTCGEECCAQLVQSSRIGGMSYGRWQFSCGNSRCKDSDIQHRSHPVKM